VLQRRAQGRKREPAARVARQLVSAKKLIAIQEPGTQITVFDLRAFL